VKAKTDTANKKFAACRLAPGPPPRHLQEPGSAALAVLDAVFSRDMSLDSMVKQLKLLSSIAAFRQPTARRHHFDGQRAPWPGQRPSDPEETGAGGFRAAHRRQRRGAAGDGSLQGLLQHLAREVAALQAEEAKRQEAARQLAAAQAQLPRKPRLRPRRQPSQLQRPEEPHHDYFEP